MRVLTAVIDAAGYEDLASVKHGVGHEPATGVGRVDELARLAELDERLLQVVEGALHEALLLLVVGQQVVPQRLLQVEIITDFRNNFSFP